MKPRLLVLSSTYPRWAGDPTPGFVHELARRLTDEFDIRVLTPHAPGAAARELLDGVDVHRYRYAPAALETLVSDGGIVPNLRRAPWKWLLVPLFLAAGLLATWRHLRRWRPDVVHAHWLIPQGLAAALLRRAGAPYLVTCHGADLYALRGAAFEALKRRALRSAAAVTVVSEPMRAELARLGVDDGRVFVEPMGVDLAGRFSADAATRRNRDELLFVGRLVEKKGLGYLLAAMPAILAQRPGALLTVVGAGPEEPSLRAQAARLGIEPQVRFLGAREQTELPALYRRAAVFVAPFVEAASGDQEGLGLTMIEAAGCGCALVLGDVPAIRSVFEGRTGARVVDARDPALLADACLAALAAPPEPSIAADLRARFDWGGRAAAYARILRSMAARA